MGFLSNLFGKPVDKVSSAVRQNSAEVDLFMKEVHPKISKYGDFTFEYLYTSSEQTTPGTYGSVIYIRIESPKHEYVATLPTDLKTIQKSIDKHQENFSSLPDHISKELTHWLYFSMGTVFRVI